jgi:PAS domain S-box-containing protein
MPGTPPPKPSDRWSSLRMQLLVPVAVVFVAVMVFQISGEIASSRQRIEREANGLARTLLANSTETVSRLLQLHDPSDAEAVVTGLGELPDLQTAALIDEHGRVVTSTRYEQRGQPIRGTPMGAALSTLEATTKEPVAVLHARGAATLVAAGAVERDPGEAPWRLVMQIDLTPRLETGRREALLHGLWFGLVRLAALVFIWIVLELRVARPATRLTATAARFGAGDLSARTHLTGASELERAGQAFDRMAEQIETGEAELRRTRSLLDGLLRSLPVGVIAVNRRDLKLLFVNPQWSEFYGQPVRLDMDYADLCEGIGLEKPDGRPYPIHELTVPMVLHTGRPAQTSDLVLLRPDGQRIPLLVTAGPVNIKGGPEFDAVVCVAQDRRDLERAFRELREWEQRYETVVALTGQVVYEWDIGEGRVRRSGSVQKVLGIPDREIATGLDQWRSHLHAEDLERVERQLETCMRERTPFDIEYRFRHGEGRWITIRDRGFIQFGDDGEPVRMLGTMLDVTERRSLEQQLRHAQKMETVGTLAGGIAHDFNNQLTGVLGHLDLLGVELPADDPRQEHVALAYRAAERCAELTSGLLAFSRRLTSYPRPVGLNATVEETVALLKRMLPATVRLSTELEPALWTALADPGQIQQVLMNLCVNARDAMPEGGALVLGTRNVALTPAEASLHPGGEAGEFVELRVSDTGSGITADTLPRIFEPFFTTKSVGSGTGLGLAMVYGIVSAHHGWVETESEAAHGATFRVLLPRALGAPARVADERRQRPRGGRETVLVVDDEPAVRDMAARALATAGYQVVCARDGDEALRIYRARSIFGRGAGAIEAVLLDLTMPGIGGRAVLAELHEMDPDARVILSSGFSSELPAGTAPLPAGQVDFLPKPYDSGPLLEIVRRSLDRAHSPAPGARSHSEV